MKKEKHYVYLLNCRDKNKKITIYCGYTSRSPSIRLQDHIRNVRSISNKHYTGKQEFVKLVYYETYDSREIALKREREIKKLGSRYKQGLIAGMRNISNKNSGKIR